MPTLVCPTYEDGMATTGLFRYYTITRGVALVINGDEVEEQRYPFQGDLDAADRYYLGGYTYTIDEDEATFLTVAGYGEFIT
jgi:hypothetical protein